MQLCNDELELMKHFGDWTLSQSMADSMGTCVCMCTCSALIQGNVCQPACKFGPLAVEYKGQKPCSRSKPAAESTYRWVPISGSAEKTHFC